MEVLEQFGISAYRTMRGRGAFICETNRGTVLLRETTSKEEKYAKEDYITMEVKRAGYDKVDTFIRTKDGNLLAEDSDKKKYYLKKWYDAVECDVKKYRDVMDAAGAIARMHVGLEKVKMPESVEGGFNIPVSMGLEERYQRKMREMKSLKNYLRKKKKKSVFERTVYETMEQFIKEGNDTIESLAASGYSAFYEKIQKEKIIAHGSCNHHNILNGKGYVAVVNFERAAINVPITDLYDFMRKILEKYNWDIKLAYGIISEYDRIRTISDDEVNVLAHLFAFPEKYFKILDHYYNSSKAWLPDKDVEKLDVALKQNEARLRFVESLK